MHVLCLNIHVYITWLYLSLKNASVLPLQLGPVESWRVCAWRLFALCQYKYVCIFIWDSVYLQQTATCCCFHSSLLLLFLPTWPFQRLLTTLLLQICFAYLLCLPFTLFGFQCHRQNSKFILIRIVFMYFNLWEKSVRLTLVSVPVWNLWLICVIFGI